MFGFFRKKETKPPIPVFSAAPPLAASTEEPKLEAAIVKLRAGNRTAYPLFIKSLLKRDVGILLHDPTLIQSCLVLNLEGHPYIAVFTKPQFAEPWSKHLHPHLKQVSVMQLCTKLSDDTVGLAINPDHPLLDYRMQAAAFRQLRGTVMTLLPPAREGGIYSIRNEDGTHSVLKILKLDEGGVHIRQYSNYWLTAPTSVNESTFFICGPVHEPEEKPGLSHLPVSKENFETWNATFVQQSTVSEEELKAYQSWKESSGEYF